MKLIRTRIRKQIEQFSLSHLMKIAIEALEILSDAELDAIINPRRACAERVTVVVSCMCVSVCLYVCLSEHAILAVSAIRSITKDAIVLSVRFAAILKRCFSLNCLVRKLERVSLTSAGRASHL